MKIRRLKMENYRRHRDVELELPDGVLAIVGPNGSGKSSILEALGFALFGAQATRTPKALLRHADAAPSDPVRVTLELELAGQALEVVREFRGLNLTAHAHLTIDGKPLVSGGANSHGAVTEEIERLLGMDRAAFFTSIVAQQKELSRLADLKAAERKQMILRLLGIDAVDRAIEAGRQKRREADQRVQDLRDTVPDMTALKTEEREASDVRDQAQADVATLEAAWSKAREALAAADSAHQEAQAQHEARAGAVRALESKQTELARLQDEHRRVHTEVARAKEARAQADAVRETAAQRGPAAKAVAEAKQAHLKAQAAKAAQAELAQVDARLAELRAVAEPEPIEPLRTKQAIGEAAARQARDDVAALGARLSQVEAHLASLHEADQDAPCPFCDQPLQHALPRLREDLGQQAAKLASQVAEAEARLTRAQDDLAAAATAVQGAQDLHHAWRQVQDESRRLEARAAEVRPAAVEVTVPAMAPLEQALATAEAAEREHIRAAALAEALPRLEQQAETLAARVAEVEAQVAAADKAVQQIPATGLEPRRQAWLKAQAHERDAERSHQQAEAALRLAEQAVIHARQRRTDGQAAKERLRAAEHDLRLWTALAGGRNSGLLEAFRTHIVGKIRPAINAEASRLLARFTDGRYRELILDEEYGVFVVDDGVPYTLDRFSGGESDLAHLALRLAVSRLLTQRSGAPELRFLALDEVFGSLDRQRRDAVLAALHSLEDMYSQVVLVTHHEGLHEALDAVLEVRRSGDASEVRFHHG